MFILLFFLIPTISACRSTAFVVPLISGKQPDSRTFIDQLSVACAISTTRDQTSILLPPFDRSFDCTESTETYCKPFKFSDHLQLALQPNINYDLKSKLENRTCDQDSTALFLIDIACSEYSKYDDLKKMFSKLGETIQWLQNLHLRMFVFYLNTKPCDQFENYKNQSDYLRVFELSYDQSLVPPYSRVCSWSPQPKRKEPKLTDRAIVGIAIASGLFLLLLLWLFIFLTLRIRRRYYESKIEWFAYQHAVHVRRLLYGISRMFDKWEITPKDLKIETDGLIGSGVSSDVYKGILMTVEMTVAAKFAHSHSSLVCRKGMMREIEIMKNLQPHNHIVKFFGCIENLEHPVIVTEFCSRGDLLKHLQIHNLRLLDLLRIASEVCSAMVYLSSHELVHRDLAARNVLLTDDLTAKVGDFGLCCHRDQMLSGEKLPVTHMPFESLKFGDFSEKSDVWSFGCLLYEMFSGGRRPFSEVEVGELVVYLSIERKPQFPKGTPESIIQLASTDCFVQDKERRSAFLKIQRSLSFTRGSVRSQEPLV